MKRNFEKIAADVYSKTKGLTLNEYHELKSFCEQLASETGEPDMIVFDAIRLAWAAGYSSGLRKGKKG